MPQCDSCQENCDSWQELAQHILQFHKSGKGIKWAQSFLTKAQILNQKRDLVPRSPLTEEQKEAKESCQRKLSGRILSSPVLCPQCNATRREALPQEFVQSTDAWKTQGNFFYTLCSNCSK